MAADKGGEARMNPTRAAFLTGLCYTLPLLVWCVPLVWGIEGRDHATSLLEQLTGLILLLQALAVVLFVPRFLGQRTWTAALTDTLVLISVPWPLLTFASLQAELNPWIVVFSQLAIGGIGLMLWGACRLLNHLSWPQTILRPLSYSTGVIGLALILASHSAWAGYLTS